MKKFTAFILSLVMLASVSACSDNKTPEAETTKNTAAPAVTTTEAAVSTEDTTELPSTEAATTAPVTEEVTTEAKTTGALMLDDAAKLLGSYEQYDEYHWIEGDFTPSQFILYTDGTVTDVTLVKVGDNLEQKPGEPPYVAKKVYEHGTLTKDRPLLIKVTFLGDVPTHGIRYTDVNGNTKTFVFGLSGYDSSIYISHIEALYEG